MESQNRFSITGIDPINLGAGNSTLWKPPALCGFSTNLIPQQNE